MRFRDHVPPVALAAQGLLQMYWHGWAAPGAAFPAWFVVSFALLPLAALIPAAWHSRKRMLLVGGIVSLLYFSHGVMELWSSPSMRPLAALEVLFAIAAIFGLRKIPKPA